MNQNQGVTCNESFGSEPAALDMGNRGHVSPSFLPIQ